MPNRPKSPSKQKKIKLTRSNTKSKSGSAKRLSLLSRFQKASPTIKALVFIVTVGLLGVVYIHFAHADEPSPIGQVALPDPDYAANEIVMKFNSNVPAEVQNRILDKFAARTKTDIPQIGVKTITVPEEALDAVTAALSHNPAVAFAEKNHIAAAQDYIPNDPCYQPNSVGYVYNYCYYGKWGIVETQTNTAWNTTAGSANAIIAILDSGVAPHPDLTANLITGYNTLDKSSNTNDTDGHGTYVAGNAAETGNNAIGTVGYCAACKIMPIKITNGGLANYSAMAAGIVWATDHGARVINISYAGTSTDSAMANAVSYARQHGAIVVAAAGNASASTPNYPAATPGVISTAATSNLTGMPLQGYSNYGTWVKIAAPSGELTTALKDPSTGVQWGYMPVGGTSLSSPAVAGIAGLLFAAKPTATVSEVEQALLTNTDTCCSGKIAGGHVNAYKAMQALLNGSATPPPDTTAPQVSIAAPANGSTLSGQVAVNVNAGDSGGIAKVELYLNGSLFGSSSSAPYGFYWDSTLKVNGGYTLTAKAYDNAGNVATSSAVNVTVNNTVISTDTIAPVVTIAAPVAGASMGNSLSVKAQAGDNVRVTSMELYLDGVLRASGTSATIASKLNTRRISAGQHTITVKAYDAALNVGSSSVVVVK